MNGQLSLNQWITTILLFKSESLTVLPVWSFRAKSGAGWPTRGPAPAGAALSSAAPVRGPQSRVTAAATISTGNALSVLRITTLLVARPQNSGEPDRCLRLLLPPARDGGNGNAGGHAPPLAVLHGIPHHGRGVAAGGLLAR